MSTTRPTTETYAATPEPGESWDRGLGELAAARTYWLSTIQDDGRPHTVPLLVVVVDGVAHFSAAAASRKARNLRRDPRCTLATGGSGLDVVLDGTAAPIDARERLDAVAAAYARKYGWQPEVREGALWAEGAPTAGEPPYLVHAFSPHTGFGFPTDEDSRPTRWRFPRG